MTTHWTMVIQGQHTQYSVGETSMQIENAPVPTQVLHNVTNTQNHQNAPFVPKVIFPHSNVTINYNFKLKSESKCLKKANIQ